MNSLEAGPRFSVIRRKIPVGFNVYLFTLHHFLPQSEMHCAFNINKPLTVN